MKDIINSVCSSKIPAHFYRIAKGLTLLERHITGHMEHPKVQQQHRHPQKSQRTFTGRFFLRVTLTLVTVALNSSGATLACNADGNSVSKRFESPNLK